MTALVFAGALSACNTTPAPTPSPTPLAQLSGHVTAGSGTGTVKLTTLTGALLTQGDVDAGGNFTVLLPTTAQLASELVTADQALSKVGCEGTLNSSVPTAKGYGVANLNLSRGSANDVIVPLAVNVTRVFGVPTSASFDGRAWLYTDQPTKLSGSLNCTKLVNAGVPITIAVNVTTVQGWNMLRLSGAAEISLSGVSVSGNLDNTTAAWTEWKTLGELRSTLTF